MAQTKESILTYPSITADLVRDAIDNSVQQVRAGLPQFTDMFPDNSSKNQFYQPVPNVDWTNGFWTGEIWLAYEHTKEACFQKAGDIQVESFLKRIQDRVAVDHHDMGFLYTPSCVAAYKLTGNETAKKAALLAADNLISRFQEKGQFIQAWGQLGADDNYRLIIDCLLNLPLLDWATEVTGNPKYSDIAARHRATALKCIVRPDYSTYHTYYFEKETGAPSRGVTFQGNRDGSAWSRGQAWGVYGLALSYRQLRDPALIDLFEHVTDYFLTHLPSDLVPYWDFDFDDGSSEPRDSSASAIAVCGMLEMAKYLPRDKAEYYRAAADRLLRALIDHCAVSGPKQSNGLLLHGVYAHSTPTNTCPENGVDECNLWGDYFYFEALTRLSKDWVTYW